MGGPISIRRQPPAALPHPCAHAWDAPDTVRRRTVLPLVGSACLLFHALHLRLRRAHPYARTPKGQCAAPLFVCPPIPRIPPPALRANMERGQRGAKGGGVNDVCTHLPILARSVRLMGRSLSPSFPAYPFPHSRVDTRLLFVPLRTGAHAGIGNPSFPFSHIRATESRAQSQKQHGEPPSLPGCARVTDTSGRAGMGKGRPFSPALS